MIHRFKEKIDNFDCDPTGRVKLAATIRTMQRIAEDHVDSLDSSYEKLQEFNMAFVLLETSLKVERLPRGGEVCSVETCAVKAKGVRFGRDVIIYDGDDNRCVSLRTVWALIDLDTRRPQRPSAYPFNLPFHESIVEGIVAEDGQVSVEGLNPVATTAKSVGYSLLDINNHVNNSYYLDFATDMLPYQQLLEKGIEKAVIAYQSEAVHGDIIDISMYQLDDGRYHFIGVKGESPCFTLTLKLKD